MAAGRQARRPRRPPRARSLATRLRRPSARIVAVGCETEPVSKNEEFLAFAEARARARSTPAAPTRSPRSRSERVELVGQARREHRDRRRRALRGGRGRACSPSTSTRRRTRSACSCSAKGELRRLRAGSRCTSRSPRRRIRSADEVPEEEVANERDDLREPARRRSRSPSRSREKIVEGMLQQAVLRRQSCSASRRGSTTRRRPSGKALAEAGLEVVEFVRFALAE